MEKNDIEIESRLGNKRERVGVAQTRARGENNHKLATFSTIPNWPRSPQFQLAMFSTTPTGMDRPHGHGFSSTKFDSDYSKTSFLSEPTWEEGKKKKKVK